jgi:hypothetical protein
MTAALGPLGDLNRPADTKPATHQRQQQEANAKSAAASAVQLVVLATAHCYSCWHVLQAPHVKNHAGMCSTCTQAGSRITLPKLALCSTTWNMPVCLSCAIAYSSNDCALLNNTRSRKCDAPVNAPQPVPRSPKVLALPCLAW